MKLFIVKAAFPGFSPVILLLYLCLFSGNLYSAQTAGWVERAQLPSTGLDIKAKLDTGAKNTSINALDMEFFTTNGKEHVRFNITNKNEETVELVKPIVRYVRIKRHLTESQRRPVIRLVICVGDIQKETEVSLIDRSKFKYPLLIGRSYLAGDFLIDSAKTFQLEVKCTDEPNS